MGHREKRPRALARSVDGRLHPHLSMAAVRPQERAHLPVSAAPGTSARAACAEAVEPAPAAARSCCWQAAQGPEWTLGAAPPRRSSGWRAVERLAVPSSARLARWPVAAPSASAPAAEESPRVRRAQAPAVKLQVEVRPALAVEARQEPARPARELRVPAGRARAERPARARAAAELPVLASAEVAPPAAAWEAPRSVVCRRRAAPARRCGPVAMHEVARDRPSAIPASLRAAGRNPRAPPLRQ
jgi:hypothetical protein